VAIFGSKEILSETASLSAQGFGICIGSRIQDLEVKIIKIDDLGINNWADDLLVEDGEIGEITVKGDIVTKGYFERPIDDSLSKIKDGDGFWHRMGDVGWLDSKGRLWYCGRKSHRVITPEGTLFTIPCESIFNNHPAVFRSALVGIGKAPRQLPAVCVELESTQKSYDRTTLNQELKDLAKEHMLTEKIDTFLVHPGFPVDIRHNAKIFREKLAEWAARKLQR